MAQQGAAHQHSARFLKVVDDAKQRIRETTIDDVKARLDRQEKFVLVDVREESEYANDHLPGAIHLGKGIIERDIEERVPGWIRRSCFTAAADTAPPWPPTIFRRWATPMYSRWMAAFAVGAKSSSR